MTTIELPHRLISPLQQLAAEQGASVEELIEHALADYLRKQRHKQLLAEMERFRAQHDHMKDKYMGQFVGMYDGRVLGNDSDGSNLYKRLRQEYGDLPILIVEVTSTPEQAFRRLQRHVVV
jgi:predicted transcriptional regulator